MRSNDSGYSTKVLSLVVFLSLAGSGALRSQGREESIEPLFNWDRVSIEQNNQ